VRVTIDCLCLLFVVDGINRQPRLSRSSMYEWKGVQEKAGEVDSTNVYVTSDEISR
jgi:hypothetical protein